MSFLQQLDGIAQQVAIYSLDIQQRPTLTSPAYKLAMEIILERVDQLAYVFVIAPFCHDSQHIYEKVKHCICAILQLIKAQQLHGKLPADDEDFLLVLFETFTKLCVRLLCENTFIEIKADETVVASHTVGHVGTA
jgi:hypothetical protein